MLGCCTVAFADLFGGLLCLKVCIGAVHFAALL